MRERKCDGVSGKGKDHSEQIMKKKTKVSLSIQACVRAWGRRGRWRRIAEVYGWVTG